MTEYIVSFPIPSEPLGENQTRGEHWAKVRRELQPWRDCAFYAWKACDHRARRIVPGDVHITIPFRTNAKRDPHNYVGTVCKAVVDGLVMAGCWPDDTPAWVTVHEPLLVHQPGPITQRICMVRITPREAK